MKNFQVKKKENNGELKSCRSIELKKREEAPTPLFVSFSELCESWTQGKNAGLVNFRKHIAV